MDTAKKDTDSYVNTFPAFNQSLYCTLANYLILQEFYFLTISREKLQNANIMTYVSFSIVYLSNSLIAIKCSFVIVRLYPNQAQQLIMP